MCIDDILGLLAFAGILQPELRYIFWGNGVVGIYDLLVLL